MTISEQLYSLNFHLNNIVAEAYRQDSYSEEFFNEYEKIRQILNDFAAEAEICER